MAEACKSYSIVAIATALALAAFVVAAVAASRALWLAAYAFVLVALGVAFLIRSPARSSSSSGRGERS
jgi:hypothetical protein